MIKKFFIELLAEMGITLPERKKKEEELPIVNEFTSRNQFDPDRFNQSETWEVRWESRHGNYSGDVKPQIAAFTSKPTSLAFAQTLEDAHKILRNTVAIKITVTKVKY